LRIEPLDDRRVAEALRIVAQVTLHHRENVESAPELE
jgi:hypothetical protein